MLTHTGVKQFKCSECLYASSRAESLKRHMRTHVGEKLSKCTVCLFATRWPSSLAKHMRHAHADGTAQPASVPVGTAVQDAHDDDGGSGDGTSMHSEDVLIGTDASKQHDMGDACHDSAATAVCVKQRKDQVRMSE